MTAFRKERVQAAHILRLSRLLACWLSISLAVVLTSCANSKHARASTPTNAPPQPYMRVAHPDSNTVALQIALRSFAPSKGRGPVVWLSGASHVGDSNYYAALQRHLDAQSLVLFEGVGARDKKMRFNPDEEASIQHTIRDQFFLCEHGCRAAGRLLHGMGHSTFHSGH